MTIRTLRSDDARRPARTALRIFVCLLMSALLTAVILGALSTISPFAMHASRAIGPAWSSEEANATIPQREQRP